MSADDVQQRCLCARYVVELRPPKAEERYITGNGFILKSATDAPVYQRRMVIVGEL